MDGMKMVCVMDKYIFNGKDRRCRSSDTFFGLAGGGCCNKDKVFMGLIECKENEKLLAKQNKAELCTEIGEYCSKKINLGFAKKYVFKNQKDIVVLEVNLQGLYMNKVVHKLEQSGEVLKAHNVSLLEKSFKNQIFQKIDLTGAFDMREINQTDLTSKINNTVENFKNMVSSGNNQLEGENMSRDTRI